VYGGLKISVRHVCLAPEKDEGNGLYVGNDYKPPE
jgi:hypothetical protein